MFLLGMWFLVVGWVGLGMEMGVLSMEYRVWGVSGRVGTASRHSSRPFLVRRCSLIC
jgi:hypothetical protein